MSEFILNSYMVLLESLHKYKNSHLVIENFFFKINLKLTLICTPSLQTFISLYFHLGDYLFSLIKKKIDALRIKSG